MTIPRSRHLVACGCCLLLLSLSVVAQGQEQPAFEAKTRVALVNGFWEMNGKPTHPGSAAEGLLTNIRVVHAVFEDRNDASRPKGFDADANTAAFVKKVPEYVAHGVAAFSVNLQGGDPGYEGAINSAYEADGSLRDEYMKRVAAVVEACDQAGAAVILGCFSPQQDQTLDDDEAIETAAKNVATWVVKRKYTNIILQIADAHTDDGYDRAVLKDPIALAKLTERLKGAEAKTLLVSSSGAPNGRVDHQVGSASDFLFMRFNKLPPTAIFARVSSAGKLVKALVCADDSKTGEAAVASLEAAVDALCSWGYANRKLNEEFPFEFKGAADDSVVYSGFKKVTSP